MGLKGPFLRILLAGMVVHRQQFSLLFLGPQKTLAYRRAWHFNGFLSKYKFCHTTGPIINNADPSVLWLSFLFVFINLKMTPFHQTNNENRVRTRYLSCTYKIVIVYVQDRNHNFFYSCGGNMLP